MMIENYNLPEWKEASEVLPSLIAECTTLYVGEGLKVAWLKDDFTRQVPDIGDYRSRVRYLSSLFIDEMAEAVKSKRVLEPYKELPTGPEVRDILSNEIILRIRDYQVRNDIKFKHEMAKYILGDKSIFGQVILDKDTKIEEVELHTTESLS